MTDSEDLWEAIRAGADTHADKAGEVVHAVVDLQEALRVAMNLMMPDQLDAFARDGRIRGIVRGEGP